VARPQSFGECSKGHCICLHAPLLLTYYALYSTACGKRIQNGSHDCHVPAKALGSKAKPASWTRVAKSKQSEGQSNKKGGQRLAHPGPHRGDPASSSFVSESGSGSFLHAPSCGLASSRPGFPDRDNPRKSLETTWHRFDRGAGALGPVWSYGEALSLAGSHP
jgi:hypothetical protein